MKSAYGETVEVDGAQFTPVALTMSGFGGGVAIPLGVYVKREEGLRFEPNFVSLLAVAIPFVWVAGRAIARIIRVLKK